MVEPPQVHSDYQLNHKGLYCLGPLIRLAELAPLLFVVGAHAKNLPITSVVDGFFNSLALTWEKYRIHIDRLVLQVCCVALFNTTTVPTALKV